MLLGILNLFELITYGCPMWYYLMSPKYRKDVHETFAGFGVFRYPLMTILFAFFILVGLLTAPITMPLSLYLCDDY